MDEDLTDKEPRSALLQGLAWLTFNCNDFFGPGSDAILTDQIAIAEDAANRFGEAGVRALWVHLRRTEPWGRVLRNIDCEEYRCALAWLRKQYPDLVEGID